jgi:hypothetical protein
MFSDVHIPTSSIDLSCRGFAVMPDPSWTHGIWLAGRRCARDTCAVGIRDRFDGDGPMLIGITFFAVVGALLLTVVLTSSTRVQWTGTSVKGVDRGGIVYYTYDGQQNSLDRTSRFMSSTVYLDPSKPESTAMLGDVADRVVDVVSVAVPFLIAATILGVGVSRRIRWRRRANDPSAGGFGHGLDPEVVQRLIQRQREGRLGN